MLPSLLCIALATAPLPSPAAPTESPLAERTFAERTLAERTLAERSPADVPPAPAEADRGAGAQVLAFDWVRDGLLTGGATLLWMVSDTVAKRALAPERCRWCDRDLASGEDRLNALDRWGRGLRATGSEDRVARWSDVTAFGLVPVTMLGLELGLAAQDGALGQGAEDVVMTAEAVALSAVLTQAVKFSVGRERPFVRTLSSAQGAAASHPEDFNLSFFSGHSSFAFSAAVAAGTVAELRGRPNRWLVWAVGLPLAATVPLLRMGADRHYLTDVVVGSAIGAVTGWAVPTLLHPRTGSSLHVSVGPDGVSLGGVWH